MKGHGLLHSAVMGVLTGFTKTLSRWSWRVLSAIARAMGRAWGAHLFAGLGIEQNPAKLNDLCRVFCDVYAVLVAGGGYVDDEVAVQVRGLGARGGLRGHGVWTVWRCEEAAAEGAGGQGKQRGRQRQVKGEEHLMRGVSCRSFEASAGRRSLEDRGETR